MSGWSDQPVHRDGEDRPGGRARGRYRRHRPRGEHRRRAGQQVSVAHPRGRCDPIRRPLLRGRRHDSRRRPVDPIRDIDTIDTELALADLETVTSSLDKSQRLARSGDKEAIARAEILKRAKTQLNQGKPVRQMEFYAEERKLVKALGLITAKKVLYVANVDEDESTAKARSYRR